MTRFIALLPEAALALTALLVFGALMTEHHRTQRARRAAYVGGVLLLAYSVKQADYEHADRLALLPVEDDGPPPPSKDPQGTES